MCREETMQTRISNLKADIEPRARSYNDSDISWEKLPDVLELPEMKALGSPNRRVLC